nr:unnamed protein product [Callosobruchus analis]
MVLCDVMCKLCYNKEEEMGLREKITHSGYNSENSATVKSEPGLQQKVFSESSERSEQGKTEEL